MICLCVYVFKSNSFNWQECFSGICYLFVIMSYVKLGFTFRLWLSISCKRDSARPSLNFEIAISLCLCVCVRACGCGYVCGYLRVCVCVWVQQQQQQHSSSSIGSCRSSGSCRSTNRSSKGFTGSSKTATATSTIAAGKLGRFLKRSVLIAHNDFSDLDPPLRVTITTIAS